MIDMAKTRDYICANCRLLERRLYQRLFEGADPDGSLRALRAYQNADGGFGQGIEPDLMCAASSAIGAETALWYVELIGDAALPLAQDVADWALAALDERGILPHPPAGMLHAPHQPWWENPDDSRILSIVGQLLRLGVDAPELYARVAASKAQRASFEGFYAYPALLYAAQTDAETDLAARVEQVAADHADHHPLYSRYWSWALDLASPDTQASAAQAALGAFQPDGGWADLYPELAWWRPIFTLDALALLRRTGHL